MSPIYDWPGDDIPPFFYIRPLGFLKGRAARQALETGQGRSLAGGGYVFTHGEVIWRLHTGGVESRFLSLSEMEAWAQSRGVKETITGILVDLSAPRPPLRGKTGVVFSPHEPLIMGVVNVTPDSFSDGGDHDSPQAAIAHGEALLAEGADILDIGGESTRPGAEPVTVEEELQRVLPVIGNLAAKGACISIDTRKAVVMEQALGAGAALINDVSGLRGDPDSLSVAAKSDVPVILMHMRGVPETMQENPQYEHVLLDIYDELAQRIEACQEAGIHRDRLVIDPGIGFGKTLAHNADILAGLSLFHGLGCRILIGVSRKRFVAALSRGEKPRDRGPGSMAAGLVALEQGASILRVHDVAETRQSLAVWQALQNV